MIKIEIFFISILIALTTLASGHDAFASQIYDCTIALENLGHLVEKASLPATEDDDIKKQLADILVLKAPILLNASYVKILGDAFDRAEKALSKRGIDQSSYNLLREAIEEAKYIDQSGLKNWGFYADRYDLAVEAMDKEAWEEFLRNYNLDKDGKPMSPRPLAQEIRLAARLGIAHEEYIKNKEILTEIGTSKRIFMALKSLVHDSMVFYTTFGNRSATYNYNVRLAFFNSLSGRMLYLNENDETYKDLVRIHGTTLEVQGLENGELIYTSEVDGESAHLRSPLVEVVGLQYPILWKEIHSEALKRALLSNSIGLPEFKRTLVNYSPQNRRALATIVWGQLLTLFDVPVGSTAEFIRQSSYNFKESQLIKNSYKMSIEDYTQARYVVQAINAHKATRATIIDLIASSLEDSVNLAVKGQPNYSFRTFFDKSYPLKQRQKFLNRIATKTTMVNSFEEE